MEGRGEILTRVPSLAASCHAAGQSRRGGADARGFRRVEKRSGAAMTLPRGGFADTGTLLRFLEGTGNDPEAPAKAVQPVIGEVLAALTGLPDVLLARMSGSGATCFALFADPQSCRRGADRLKASAQWLVGCPDGAFLRQN